MLQELLGANKSREERQAESLNKKAMDLIARNQLDRAEEALLQAIKIKPDMGAAHHNLGAVYLAQKKLSPALKHMRRAVRLDPHDIESQIAVARIYGDMGKREECLAEYTRICQEAPDDWRSQISLGNALLERGQTAEAIEHLERAVQLNPKEELTHLVLATAYERQGDLERAVKEYRAVRNTTRVRQNRSAASHKMRELQVRLVQEGKRTASELQPLPLAGVLARFANIKVERRQLGPPDTEQPEKAD